MTQKIEITHTNKKIMNNDKKKKKDKKKKEIPMECTNPACYRSFRIKYKLDEIPSNIRCPYCGGRTSV